MFGALDRDYKPVQLYQLNGIEGVSCRVLTPAESLLEFIHYYWVLEISCKQVDLPVIPDNAVDLVLSPNSDSVCALYFPQAEKYEIPLDGPITYIGLCFQMQRVSRLFERPIDELRRLETGNQTAQALSLEQLVADIQGVRSDPDIQDRLDRYFSSIQMGPGDSSESLLFAEFVDRLEPVTIKTLAASVGLSERQFRRLSIDHFGLSPKKLQRVMRLQQALAAFLDEKQGPMDDGYYDDSHRISELKKLTGMTPTEIRRMAEIYNQSKS